MARTDIGLLALLLATGLALSGTAAAQQAGSTLARFGVTKIKPDVKSGDLTPPSFAGTRADIEADTQPTAGLTYMVSDHLAIDLPLSAGFRHDIVGDGAFGGVGKIGEVKALPITLLAQWRFLDADAPLRPYVGIGPTYAKFYKARSTAVLTALTGGSPANPTTLAVESKWALTAQVGASLMLSKRWFADVSLQKTALKTRMTLSTGQTLDATLDPWSACLSIGVKF